MMTASWARAFSRKLAATHGAFAVAACAAAATNPAPPAASVRTLAAGESVALPGGGTLSLVSLTDDRCRTIEHCSAAERASRSVAAETMLVSGTGQRYLPGALVLGEAGQARAKLGDWLVELADVSPAGRALPADGPNRVQRATLWLTPADRVSVGVGSPVELPRAGFRLGVVAIDDHRCPQGVQCASPGYVQVTAEFAGGAGVSQRVVFGGPSGPLVHVWQGHEVQLCDVQPRVRLDGSVPSPAQADFFVSPAPKPPASAGQPGLGCVRPMPGV